mmetsp:Transcript_15766/g.30474  ORF Transcript_15766/g.30474 Transcript_15766/m.30474 type:complete len:240 (-) Transcript_15766:410-1129(-)|eukprot:CAMPEP_0171525828 /NCGR_PEP_ID=MMETSP0959-20130129/9993_1 /TAXON_ID=87120 /ORGANISM="Aurantiochytrium limacinum, Strain ATCCMYA-1381" /LENGTH=239 /DNA_ID=CAMNT_0012067061 /DNA_START=13 /DNA_END=732 /DNA_ORIENTATION=-
MGGGGDAKSGSCGGLRRAEVPFLKQEDNWDCGLACVKMVTSALRPLTDPMKLTNAALETAVETRSVWTIDLVYALRDLDVPLVMYTTCTEIKPREYEGMEFYKELASDQTRVNQRFREAADRGIRIVPRSFARTELQNIFANPRMFQLAIVLVDVNIIRKAERSYGRKVLDFVVSAVAGHQFAGHYIVVVDYIAPMYEIRDPAGTRAITWVHEDVLEQARLAPGTDEDIIILGEELSNL